MSYATGRCFLRKHGHGIFNVRNAVIKRTVYGRARRALKGRLSRIASTNYYLILGLRDKAAPSTSPQINKFPPKRVKNLATPSSFFLFFPPFFPPPPPSFTGEPIRGNQRQSQPIRGNDRPIGRMFPEHVERRFLDPEYSLDEYLQLGSRRNVGPIKNQLASPNTSN